MNLRGPKLTAEILFNNGDSVKKKCRVESNTVVIIKPSNNDKVGWQPKFHRDSIVKERKGRILRSKREKVMVRWGADECLRFKDDDTNIPNLNPETVKRLFKASVIDAAGRSLLNLKIPWYVTLLIFITFMLQIINFLAGRGIGF